MRVDGKFMVGSDIPEGQGSVTALLAECFDIQYELKVQAEERDAYPDEKTKWVSSPCGIYRYHLTTIHVSSLLKRDSNQAILIFIIFSAPDLIVLALQAIGNIWSSYAVDLWDYGKPDKS